MKTVCILESAVTALTILFILAVALYLNLVAFGVNDPVAVQFFCAYRFPVVGSLAVQTINKINAESANPNPAAKRVK